MARYGSTIVWIPIDPDKYTEEELAEFINALRDIGKYHEAAELEAEVLNKKAKNE